MLSVAFHFESQERGVAQFELRLTPRGPANPALVTAHLPDQEASGQLEVDGPPLWSECAYKTINRAVHTVAACIDAHLENAQIRNLQISFKAISKSEARQPEISKISFVASESGGQVIVAGLIGAAVFSIETERKDLYSVVARIFAFCGLPWPQQGEIFRLPTVPVYHGDSVDDFIFVNELPAGTARWFVAFETAFKRNATYRDGIVAPLAAWREFQNGDF